MTHYATASAATAFAACATLALGAQIAPQQPPPAQQPKEVTLTIIGPPGLPPKFAVPDFIALSNDAETVAAAKTMGQVLWDDLNYEREFYLIPRDTYRTIPQPRVARPGAARSVARAGRRRRRSSAPSARPATASIVQVRLLEVATGTSALREGVQRVDRESAAVRAHDRRTRCTCSSAALKGVARTKIAFTSDRDSVRIKGPVGDRGISEIYLRRLRRRQPAPRRR